MNAEYIAEAYRQLAFVSAVVGGLSFAVIGLLLVTDIRHTVVNWVIGCAMFSAVNLILCTLLAMLLSLTIGASEAGFPPQHAATRPWIQFTFTFGLAAFLVSLGLSGWIRSRRLGWLSSVLGAVGLVALSMAYFSF